MKKTKVFLLIGALLMTFVGYGQQVALSTSHDGADLKALAQRLADDAVFQEYTLKNWNYLKVVDEWLASLSPEQQKARKEGELMMPEFYTEEERQQHHQAQHERMNKISERFPEVRQLPERERQWVRQRATNLVLKQHKKE